MLSSMFKKAGLVAVAVASAGVLAAAPASATQACTDLHGPAGGTLPLCKSWFASGSAYYGKWWPNGPSSLPSHSYLQRYEDGRVSNSATSGSYSNVKRVAFRLCDSLQGTCTGWW